ncbi:prepilin peptidase [Neobacillus sp. WH10]|uniref:A24 family peptidase n=1 Tax=Neobacillus sp. WH10 TaxID=3047873 RepID=UPI0024C0FE46|nr:prepilin peptidase [Neobacillus sp. WH10]WHY76783.1 prepilin peptidase [Neobacillus sp. WH10]
MIIEIVLVTILIISLYTDIRDRKILNIVTLPTILFAFIFHIGTQGMEGFLFSGKGFLTGLGLLIIPYLLGGMGAGDVKLMAAIGALMGTNFVFYSFIYTALIGGVIALVLIIKQKGLVNSMKSFFYTIVFFRSNLGSMLLGKDKHSSISFPYGIAIVLGTLCSLIWGGF